VREASLGPDRTDPRAIVNGLSVDVEEYFQVGAFENTIASGDWDGIASRVEFNTGAVLDLFARCGVKATFFTLGWVAHRHPALIRRIIAEGHEIASHGWDHTRVFTMTPDQFRADIDRARAALEDAGGVAIRGYRAPSFSIDQRTPWAHPILAEQGYAYSSSVAPIAHDHYGWRAAPRFAFHPVEGSDLIELPVTTVELGERRFGAGGGGFFRILPYALSRWALRRVNGNDGQPAIFYFHPWEVDPDQPRVANAPLKSRVRHYTGLGAMAGKLEQLTRDFHWCRIDEIALPLVAGRL
jgi:polysaccharide deacetylase family protein (PEP-CTERM system associated)